MARLTIEQVKAPDFSASSEMLARANQSFNTGIDSAKGILDKYNTGQQAKGDQALVGALAGLKSEDELANFLQTTDLTQMNISDTMRQNILTAREAILGNNATRQSTTNAADANSRANAGEGRVAADYADGVAARDELRALTPAYVGALTEGQTYGRGPNTNQDWLAYNNQGATRNDPLSPELVQSMSFLGDMGVTMRVTSGGQENNTDQGTGSTRHNHGNAADADFYIGDHKLDWNNPQDLPIFQQIVTQARANGVTGIGAGDDYMGAGRMHVGFGNPGVWGADGKGANAPDWLTAAYNGASAGTAPITRNGTGGEAAAAFTAALQAGTRMAPDQAAALFNNVLNQQTAGQTLIDAAEAKRQDQLSASAQISAFLSPNNLTQPDVQRDLADTAGLDATRRLDLLGGDYSQYSGVIAPPVTQSADVAAAGQVRTDQIARDQVLASENQPFLAAQKFDNSSDTTPGTALAGSIAGAADNPALAPAAIDNAIGAFAKANGITNGEAAVVFQTVGQGNAELMQKLVGAVSAESEVNDNWVDTSQSPEVLSLNNMAEKLFSQSARDSFDARRVESVRLADIVKQNQADILMARTSAAKFPNGSPERVKAEAEVRKREVVDMALNQPQQTKKRLADYFGMDPSELAVLTSTEKSQMAQRIQSDENLSDEQKLLLITATRI